MASLIPDSVKATFGDLLETYGQIEAIKLQKRMVDAQASLGSLGLPMYMQDAQALGQSALYQPMQQRFSNGTLIMLGVGALVAVYLIAK